MHMFDLIPIATLEDANRLRIFRNECRTFMTRHTDEISYEQQVQWYSNLDTSKNKLFLFYKSNIEESTTYPIGYGYLRIEDGSVLLTGGLTESERDFGYGKILFNQLVEKAKEFNLPIKLEVLKENVRAFKVYEKLGFEWLYEDDRNIFMEYK